MAYSKQTWANTAGGGTPLNESRLNHMEDGIDQAYKGQYLIDAATPYDPGVGTDEFIVYRDGATPSTGKITLDAIKAFMLANGLSSLTLEQVQDSVSGMLVAGSAITLTYNDGANTLTIDAATPPTNEQVQDIVAAMFVEGTDIDIAYNDGAGTVTIAYTGTGGGTSDPYGLLADSGAVAADEFDDATIGPDWVQIAPASGSVTWDEGNHKLTAVVNQVPTNQAAAIVMPLTALGGAWSGTSVFEACVDAWSGSSDSRIVFQLADGATANSASVGYHLNRPFTIHHIVKGTLDEPYATAYTSLTTPPLTPVRVRLVATSSGTKVKVLISQNGVTWIDGIDIDAGSEYTLGFTPTHVGFTVIGTHCGFDADYVRRIAS